MCLGPAATPAATLQAAINKRNRRRLPPAEAHNRFRRRIDRRRRRPPMPPIPAMLFRRILVAISDAAVFLLSVSLMLYRDPRYGCCIYCIFYVRLISGIPEIPCRALTATHNSCHQNGVSSIGFGNALLKATLWCVFISLMWILD